MGRRPRRRHPDLHAFETVEFDRLDQNMREIRILFTSNRSGDDPNSPLGNPQGTHFQPTGGSRRASARRRASGLPIGLASHSILPEVLEPGRCQLGITRPCAAGGSCPSAPTPSPAVALAASRLIGCASSVIAKRQQPQRPAIDARQHARAGRALLALSGLERRWVLCSPWPN